MALLDKFLAVDPDELADFLVERRNILPRGVKEKLRNAFSAIGDSAEEDLDLKSEVAAQIKAARALRQAAITPTGVIIGEMKDAKDAITTTTSLLTLLTKLQGEIYNQDRVRTVQRVTIEVLKEVDPEVGQRFLTLLQERLGVSS